MKHFEVGDTVRCIKPYDGNKQIVNEQGVLKIFNNGCVGVEFFNDIHGHGDCGKSGHCWYFCEFDGGLDCLELVSKGDNNMIKNPYEAYNGEEEPKTVYHCDCCGDDIKEGDDYFYYQNPEGSGYIRICEDCMGQDTAELIY